jgi:3-oxoacyl-[acyl-carrier protein] reductase
MPRRDTVALVTGAGRGLGWGIAWAFGLAGARLCVTDVRDDELARCARDLAADDAEFQSYVSDVADLAECQRVVKRIVERFGRLDVVVHNAIYMPLVEFDATTPAEWSRQIDVGLGGLFNCTHAVWNQMKTQGGGHIPRSTELEMASNLLINSCDRGSHRCPCGRARRSRGRR